MSSTLVIMIGLPRAGKSTLVNKLARSMGGAIICPDDYRQATYGKSYASAHEPLMWSIVGISVIAALRRHNHVWIDATHTTKERRDEWLMLLRRHGMRSGVALKYVLVEEDYGTCISRAQQLPEPEATGLVGAINRMYEQWEPVNEDAEEWRELDLRSVVLLD